MQHHMNQSNHGSWHYPSYFAYSFVMFFILTVGFLGNSLTILVLREREHRSRSITPLMMNLALADVFIIVFGYPIAIQANLRGQLFESSFCSWGGFVNGAVGITSIFTLTEMSVMAYHGLKQVNASSRYSASQVACLIGTAWLYGILCMLPPLLGWNRFVVSASKISCCPDWAGKSAWDTAYNILLVILGFFVPLAAIIVYYCKIYSLVHRTVVPGNVEVQLRQRTSEMKVVKMTAVIVSTFMLSWAPYCFVSLGAVFTKNFVLADWEAEIPELLAKASVIYNPVIYTIMNGRFRETLFRILRLRRRTTTPEVVTVITRNHRTTAVIQEFCLANTEHCAGLRHLQVPSLVRRNSINPSTNTVHQS